MAVLTPRFEKTVVTFHGKQMMYSMDGALKCKVLLLSNQTVNPAIIGTPLYNLLFSQIRQRL